MKIQGYFTNADEFLGSMSANDWEHVKAVCETNNLDDGSYKVHPTFRALAKVAWWNGTLELLERGPDMYEAGEEAEKYIEAIKALDFNKEYDDLKRSSCRTKRIPIALGPLHTSLICFIAVLVTRVFVSRRVSRVGVGRDAGGDQSSA